MTRRNLLNAGYEGIRDQDENPRLGRQCMSVKGSPTFRRKVDRIRSGAPIRTLDLFAGCGGLSLGFQRAGFAIVGAVEIDPIAAQSHARNFCSHLPREEFLAHAQAYDITESSPASIVRSLHLGERVDDAVDVVIGGPPCQAFARVGRAKLREVDAHPEAFKLDPRADLYLQYLHYVRELRPVALLMENVPDALNHGGHNIAEEVCEVLDDLGYTCSYTLLNAAYYGVPQMRERMFLVAYARELSTPVRFPQPTNWVELPRGYDGSRQVALKSLSCCTESDLFFDADRYYTSPPAASPALPAAVTAQAALDDLAPITLHLEGRLHRGARRFTEEIPYKEPVEPNTYAWEMRHWPGYEAGNGVSDHVIRYLPRDYDIFRRMNPGDQYPEAHKHALDLFNERLVALSRRTGQAIGEGSAEYQRLYRETVPPYDPGKFPNKWRKMEADRPARTLMAHLGKDSYSHIHYDSSQARTISVREAARLQSFPDGFVFEGTMNPAFRQIGNAVPPLLAGAVAKVMLEGIVGGGGVVEAGPEETLAVGS